MDYLLKECTPTLEKLQPTPEVRFAIWYDDLKKKAMKILKQDQFYFSKFIF